MFKRVLLAIVLILLLTMPTFADQTGASTDLNVPYFSDSTNEHLGRHTHPYVDENTDTQRDDDRYRNMWEPGLFLDGYYVINKNWEVGAQNEWLPGPNYITSTVGAVFRWGGSKEKNWQ